MFDWLIERERENIKNISNWSILFMEHFLWEITIDVLSEKIYIYKITVQCINSFYISADFATDVLKQKWDRVKIICRQPFRRNVQMGLSFVCFKTTEADAISSPENKLNTPKSVKSIQKHFFGKLSSR